MPSQVSTQENPAPEVVPAPSVMSDHQLAVTFHDESSDIVDCSGILSSQNPGVDPLLAPHGFVRQYNLSWACSAGQTKLVA